MASTTHHPDDRWYCAGCSLPFPWSVARHYLATAADAVVVLRQPFCPDCRPEEVEA